MFTIKKYNLKIEEFYNINFIIAVLSSFLNLSICDFDITSPILI